MAATGFVASLEATCRRWLGIGLPHASRIAGFGFITGAGMEAFMIKGWIGKTNFYETVKKKEVEKQLEIKKEIEAGERVDFAKVLKEQWEQRKKEMAEQEQQQQQQQSRTQASTGAAAGS